MTNFSFEKNVLFLDSKSIKFEFPIYRALSNNNLIIVLLHPDSNLKKWGQYPNLFGVNITGEILWKAQLPTTDTGDSYYQMKFYNHQLWADSKTSYSCHIDLNSGNIIEKIFYK